MKIRWYVTCDKNGMKTEPELQVFVEMIGAWRPVPYVEEKLGAETTDEDVRDMEEYYG